MNVYYLLEQDFQKLIELQIIKDKKGVNLLKRYLEQIGQTSIVEEGNVNNNKEYDVKKREYEDNLTKKFRSTMLKDAAVKVQYKQSIEAQLDHYVDIVDFRLYLVYYYSRLVNCYCYSLKILQPRILWYSCSS